MFFSARTNFSNTTKSRRIFKSETNDLPFAEPTDDDHVHKHSMKIRQSIKRNMPVAAQDTLALFATIDNLFDIVIVATQEQTIGGGSPNCEWK